MDILLIVGAWLHKWRDKPTVPSHAVEELQDTIQTWLLTRDGKENLKKEVASLLARQNVHLVDRMASIGEALEERRS